MTDIHQFDPSSLRNIQGRWQYETTACGRVAADFGLPIVCDVSTSNRNKTENRNSAFSPGRDWELFSECCPWKPNAPDYLPSVFKAQWGCSTHFCYTRDVSVATNWTRCLDAVLEKEYAKKFGSGWKDNGTIAKATVSARCEYINYEMIERGVEEAEAPTLALPGKMTLVGLLTAVMVAVTI